MKLSLKNGLPKKDSYIKVINTKLFKEMEVYSESFLSNNKDLLNDYSNKWVKDPLHQWSRQYEYFFVYNEVQNYLDKFNRDQINILDAGSGITFFPFFIRNKYINSNIHCLDYDPSLKKIFFNINLGNKFNINFENSGLQKIPYNDNMFDIIYCISVLEHTNNYEKIIDEFYRVLKSGGELIITFDISIDGGNDISIGDSEKLIDTLNNKFGISENASIKLTSDIFTTKDGLKMSSKLIPWTKPSLKSQLRYFVKNISFIKYPPNMTFYSMKLQKNE